MMFGLPFPTYLGWIVQPLSMVIMLAVCIYFYRKNDKEESDKK